MDVESNITHISLDLGKSERELVCALVGYGTVGREFEVVVRLQRDNARLWSKQKQKNRR